MTHALFFYRKEYFITSIYSQEKKQTVYIIYYFHCYRPRRITRTPVSKTIASNVLKLYKTSVVKKKKTHTYSIYVYIYIIYFLNINCVIYLLLLNEAYRLNSYTAKKRRKTMFTTKERFFNNSWFNDVKDYYYSSSKQNTVF